MSGHADGLRPASVFDRLLDDAPDLMVEIPQTRAAHTRALTEAVRRDLEALLNARRRPTTPPASLPELRRSLFTYGMSDFVSANLITAEQRRIFAAKLAETIRMFEPRFKSVSVTVLDPRDAAERVLRLRIEALMVIDSDPVPMLFQTNLNPATLRFSIAEVGGV